MHSTTAKLLLVILPLLVAGCRWGVKDDDPPPAPTIVTEYVYLTCTKPPERDPIELRPISWRIVDSQFTLTPQGYEDLSYNVTEIWKGVEQLQAEVAYYEQCNGEHDTDVD